MENTSSKFATMRRYLNWDYVFCATVLAGCAALLVYAEYVTAEVICR